MIWEDVIVRFVITISNNNFYDVHAVIHEQDMMHAQTELKARWKLCESAKTLKILDRTMCESSKTLKILDRTMCESAKTLKILDRTMYKSAKI